MNKPYARISDVDDTLLGNDDALREFVRYHRDHARDLALVYASGRMVESLERVIKATHLPRPEATRRELVFYAGWYNESRPRQALSGMTPAERDRGAGSLAKSFEPRPRWPADDGAVRVKRLQRVVESLEGRKLLPIVELKRAA